MPADHVTAEEAGELLADIPSENWWIDAGGPDETCELVIENSDYADLPFYAPHRNEGIERMICASPRLARTVLALHEENARLRAALNVNEKENERG